MHWLHNSRMSKGRWWTITQLYIQLHAKIVHDQCTRACCGIGVVSRAVPTGKVVAQKTWKAGDTVSVRTYTERIAWSRAQCYCCTASARCHRKCTSVGPVHGRLDQKPTSVTSTTTDLKDPLRQFLLSYQSYSRYTKSIPEYQNRIKSINSMYKN